VFASNAAARSHGLIEPARQNKFDPRIRSGNAPDRQIDRVEELANNRNSQ
jgi:hypothetical protein